MFDINKLVDHRNAELWRTLNEHFKIALEPSSNNEYSVYSINDMATFYVVPENLCPDSFTHELLHVYLRFKKIFISAAFKNTVKRSNTLKNLLSEPLLEHIGNCLDHIKMFEKYSEMGFDPAKFILDYDKHKCSAHELAELKRYYKQNGSYNSQAVDLYVGKFVAMCADFNEDFDYTACFDGLDKLDPQLFTILDQLITDWEELDIENDDILISSYYPLLTRFYDCMKIWLNGKRFHV